MKQNEAAINMAAPVTHLPPLNENYIKNWFLQLRFAHLVPTLPPPIIDKVADILEAVREHEPYSNFKEAIIKCTGHADEDLIQLHQLINRPKELCFLKIIRHIYY